MSASFVKLVDKSSSSINDAEITRNDDDDDDYDDDEFLEGISRDD